MNLHEAFSKACEDRSHYTGTVPNRIVDWQEIGHSTFLSMNVRADEKFWNSFWSLVEETEANPFAKAIIWVSAVPESRRAQILWSKTLAKQERIAAKTKRKSMGERINQAFIDESEQAKLFDELSPGHHYK